MSQWIYEKYSIDFANRQGNVSINFKSVDKLSKPWHTLLRTKKLECEIVKRIVVWYFVMWVPVSDKVSEAKH